MLTCILCGAVFQSEIEDPAPDERHLTLTCSAHSDEQLRELDLDDLWGGDDRKSSRSYFSGRETRIVAAWDYEGGQSYLGVYVLLDDGDLLMFFGYGLSHVDFARVRLRCAAWRGRSASRFVHASRGARPSRRAGR